MIISKRLKNKKNFYFLFSFIVFCFYICLSYNMPLTGDDWFWGSSGGIEKLSIWFKNYNGRYLGNLFEILLTRVQWVRVVIMSSFETLLVLLVANSEKYQYQFKYLLSLFLLLCIPVSVTSQTYAWIAGFSNYITSVVFILLYLVIIKNIFEDQEPSYSSSKTLLVIPIGIGTQLFVEHITIYAVFMATLIIIYTYIKFRKFFLLQILYLISTVFGAVIMFSNGAYTKIINGNDGYRSVNSVSANIIQLLKMIYSVYTEKINSQLFLNNIVLNLFISFFCIIIILKNENEVSVIVERFKKILLIVFFIYPLSQPICVNLLGFNSLEFLIKFLGSIVSIIFYLSIIITVIFYTDNRNMKHKVIFYLFSAVFLVIPLFFVNPIGPRNFLASYVFFVMATIQLSHYVFSKKYIDLSLLKKIVVFGSFLIAMGYIYVFATNYKIDVQRISNIKQIVLTENKKSIVIPRLPYEQFLWMSTPELNGFQYEEFKRYYGLSEKIKIQVVPFSQWQK